MACLALAIAATPSCQCGGIGMDRQRFACSTAADCIAGYSCVDAVCTPGAGDGEPGHDGGESGGDGGGAGGATGGGTGGATGGGAGGATGGGTGGGCASSPCGCFDAGACYQGGLDSPQLRYPWDGGAGCSAGAWTCGGAGPVCGGQHVPQQELCDGIDTDCDGVPDPPACGCLAGRACYRGPPNTIGANPLGKTTCRPGVWNCTTSPSSCVGQVLPAAVEQCDGLDDDCDGVVDNAPFLPPCGAGVCAQKSKTCSGGALVACTYALNDPPGYSPTELCGDGLDNNCNGQVDEGCACTLVDAGASCWTGSPTACPSDGGACLGICSRGTLPCVLGPDGGAGFGACAGQALASGENTASACTDGLDNDCDGLTDCADPDCAGQRCGTAGLLTCASGTCACAVSGGTVELPKELSCGDGRDNDCNGLTDCADPNCANTACGTHGQHCSGIACTCGGNGGVPQAAETTCNDGFDNDCNGLIDCADSNCAGRVPCVASCLPDGGVPTAVETNCMNGIDDDCDGKTDCVDPDCYDVTAAGIDSQHRRCDANRPAAYCCGNAPNAVACKDLSRDPANCGMCGAACGGGTTCVPVGDGTAITPFSGACACTTGSTCPSAPGASPETGCAGALADGGLYCTCRGNNDQCGPNPNTFTQCTQQSVVNARYCFYTP